MQKEYTFDVIFEPLEEGGYLVIVPSLPGIITHGESLAEAKRMAVDAIRCHCEGLLKDGEQISDNTNVTLKPRIERLKVALQL
jgi:antitoxin HicB